MKIFVACVPHLCRHWQGVVLANAIYQSLSSLGYETEIGPTPSEKPDIIISMGVKSLSKGLKKWGVPIVLYNVDFFEMARLMHWEKRLGRFGFSLSDFFGVIDFSPLSKSDFSVAGIDRHVFCALGYHKSFEMLDDPDIWSEVYDVGFLGTMRRRRSEVTSLLREQFCVQDALPLPGEHRAGMSDASVHRQTAAFLGTSSIWLHVNRKPGFKNFPDIRIIQLGLSNRQFVLSERTSWVPDGLVSGEHMVFCDYEDIQEQVGYYVEHPEERARISRNGYEWVRSFYRLEDSLRVAMKEVDTWMQ